MDAVVRAAVIYIFLLVVFRIGGERTMASMTTFDFVLLLIIAEATQQGLIGDDFSITKVMIVVVTLMTSDFHFSRIVRAFFIRSSRVFPWSS